MTNSTFFQNLIIEIISSICNGSISLIIALFTILIVNIIISHSKEKREIKNSLFVEKQKSSVLIKKRNAEELFVLLEDAIDFIRRFFFDTPLRYWSYFPQIKSLSPEKVRNLIFNHKELSQNRKNYFDSEFSKVNSFGSFLNLFSHLDDIVDDRMAIIDEFVEKRPFSLDREMESLYLFIKVSILLLQNEYKNEIENISQSNEDDKSLEKIRIMEEKFSKDMKLAINRYKKAYIRLYES